MISSTEVTGRAARARQVPLVVQILTTTDQTKGKEVQKGMFHILVSLSLSDFLASSW